MLFTPHQVALVCRELGTQRPELDEPRARWTWIAGRRYRGVGWL